ncbi:uncharacterized protein LOC128996929 [Macrosteles quadrilineatus]|uniref:uncharacterized protein LOC128996929 n=1 Tax=Macrosteles quadrilineatus TaxID=74068 RepID=UPI0023E27253|nr:uncharacterized protein LOC128996929 [Macrosteles quadrilineatus]
MGDSGFSIFIVCSLFLQIQTIAGDNTWTNFKVRFAPPEVGQWGIPLTLDQAREKGYVKAATQEDFSKIGVYCLDKDPRACPMYDTKGKLCGFRIGYVIDTLSQKCQIGSNYHYETIETFIKGTIFQNMDYYYTDFIFSTPASLEAGGPATRKAPLGDSLHVKLDGKTWTEIPKKEEDILKFPGIVKQACFKQMGQHYFFIDKNTNCADARPFFAMYHEGDLVAIGMVAFGSVSKTTRDWYEDIPSFFPKMTFSDPPECLTPTIGKCGGIGMHMYFTEKPEDIICPKLTNG